jgi:outer membrane immunogenic protein
MNELPRRVAVLRVRRGTATALIVTSAVLLLTGTAAADPGQWSGPYFGGQASYLEGNSKDHSNANASGKTLYGAAGGLQAGYLWQFDNRVVLGVEADLSLGSLDRRWKDSDIHEFSPYYGRDAITGALLLNGKLGYAAGPWLTYASAGATFARQRFMLGCDKSLVDQTNGCRVAEYETSTSHTATGTHVGAGVQYRFSDRLSGGLEYLHHNLGSSDVSLYDPNFPNATRRSFHTDYSSVTLKLNYHF